MEPRLPVEKLFYHRKKDESPAPKTVREYLLKVWWYQEEENPLSPGSQLQIAVGTTLAWDRDTREPQVLLTSSRRGCQEEEGEQKKDRGLMLRKLAEEGVLQPGPQKLGPDGRPLRMTVSVEGTDQVMRVANVARMLHIMK